MFTVDGFVELEQQAEGWGGSVTFAEALDYAQQVSRYSDDAGQYWPVGVWAGERDARPPEAIVYRGMVYLPQEAASNEQ